MEEKFSFMIPGADPSGKELKVVAPFDGELIATLPTAGGDAVDSALATAYALYRNRDAWLPPARRLEVLGKSIHIISSRADQLAKEAAREGGKPLLDSRIEIARAIDGLKSCIEILRTDSGTEIPMNLNSASEGRLAFTRKEPVGVVVAVSAFNHPFNLIAHQVGPAVAVGCPVIVKPATDTPLSCFRFVQILREAGLPEEWCQALVAADRDTSTRLITDERVGFLSFIGSPEVGWMLRSKLAAGTRCALEHGGAAPVMLAADADIDDALPLLVKGGFYHAGQVCVSVQRIFVHQSIARDFAGKLADEAARLKIGDPTRTETEVGPLIRPAEVDRVEKWVDEAVQAGAQLLTGGKRISDSCYECTVLFDPPHDAKVSQLEIFGPVVCVYPYSDLGRAIEQANSLPYAFQAAVFTRDINTAMRGAGRLDASAVMINDHTAFRVDWMPFAGLRQSGLAVGGIPYTMRDMQIEKMIVIRSREL
jgi:acyl-CoA reductase-like NAD-dependent aldehyde dehydrogenase